MSSRGYCMGYQRGGGLVDPMARFARHAEHGWPGVRSVIDLIAETHRLRQAHGPAMNIEEREDPARCRAVQRVVSMRREEETGWPRRR